MPRTTMSSLSPTLAASPTVLKRFPNILVGLIGFLTLTDLFAAQAILPSLAQHYQVMPSEIGLAVNAGTIGMALSSIGIAIISSRLNRRLGISISLALLAIPTVLLAFAPDLASFAGLRILQGVFMASAFALTMAYLAETSTAEETATALAAYVTGVVASNLVGRLLSAVVSDLFGLGLNFYLLAALNVSGALLVFAGLRRMALAPSGTVRSSNRGAWAQHLGDTRLLAAFGLAFLILFVFIGIFTYVNFVLTADPVGLGPMSLGLVYFVFVPSMFSTPLAGKCAARFGVRNSVWTGLLTAALGLPLLLLPSLPAILAGMILVGVGTFFAQAIGTGYVGRVARSDRATASGLYLASYYIGGLAGAFLLGQVFDQFGWPATVAMVGVALGCAALLALKMRLAK